ncbi:MAG: hypothetical protein MI741_10305, partial [Rhodospirillales bacterium]|nr:hypothetical protein [Rhodospirillales bacterium]
ILEKASKLNGRGLDSVAVIPERGPGLDPRSIALKPLAGKPVMDWTIDAALEAKRVSRVLVTSPDPDILAHVRDTYGERVTAFERDWHLALPRKSLDETITALFNSLPNERRTFDALTLLFIDSPFRTARHIDSAVDVLETFDCNRVIGVRRLKGALYCHQGRGMVPLRESDLLRQESEEVYRTVGSLMVIRRGHLYRDTNLDRSIGHIELEERAAHRIFSKWSWQIAEAMAERLMAKKSSAKAKVKAIGSA